MWKRSFDITVSGILLVIAMPVMLAIWLVVYLTSPGPGIFRQVRVGKDGVPFTILKFRTLRDDCDKTGLMYRSLNTQFMPTTWPGRFLRQTHLDELPQLWNVLNGDMSLVGPRPITLHLHAQLLAEEPRFREREKVRPGLTGIGQVLGRNKYQASLGRRALSYDVLYLKRASLRLDLYIISLTVVHVLGRRGV